MIAIFIVILVLLISFNKSTSTCTKLSVTSLTDELTTVCYQAVDYDFYLPQTKSLEDLNNLARESLNSTYLAILPSDCKMALLKLACSNIYLKCSNNPNGNTHIYSDVGKPIPLPFERPCKSLCSDVSSKCFGLLNVFGLEPNCTAKYDYLFGYDSIYGVSGLYPYQYDQTNSNYCNNVSASVYVASSYEPYLKSESNGACAGIVSKLYIPPPSAVDASFSPMLPPYTIQSIIEETIASNLEVLPKWLGESCHLALRKYFCGSYMLFPQLKTFQSIIESFGPYAKTVEGELKLFGVNTTALSTFDFYLPSYPSLEVCEDYATECKYFIELAGIAALTPSCSAVESGIAKYPNKTQTIVTLSLAGKDVYLTSDPNSMSDANDNDYQPSCPRGFVIPDDPDDSGVTYVPGSFSACAIPCKNPMFTSSEYDNFTRVSDIGSNVALAMVVFLLMIWMIDETRRKQYLVISFNVIALIVTIQCVYMSSIPFEKKFCRNNAVGISSRDGLTGCNVQSFFIVYFIFAEAINWCLISIDLFLKVVLRQNTNNYYLYYFVIMFTIPLISVSIMAGKSNYGYFEATTTCQVSRIGNWDFKLFIIPIIVVTGIGFIAMTFVIYKIYDTAKNVKGLDQPKNRRKSSVIVPVAQSASNYTPASASGDSHDHINLNSPSFDGHQLTQIPESEILNKDDFDINKGTANNSKSNVVDVPITVVKHVIPTAKKEETTTVEAKATTKIPWKMIRTPVIFVVLYFGVWLSLFIYRFEVYFNSTNITNSFISWTECAFTYYDGTNSWISKCGEHPKTRASYTLNLWLCFIVNAHAIVVSGIFLLNPTIWFTYCDKITNLVSTNRRSSIVNRSAMPSQQITFRHKQSPQPSSINNQ